MTLRVAVQMDPLETININGDSSFQLMLSAQERGHELWHYDVKTLALDTAYEGGERITCWAAPVTVQRVEGRHFQRGDYELLDLGRDMDIVLMRQDPPFDLGYITGTHILERLTGRTLVVNDPAAVRNAPEKVLVLDYARFMPPTFVARRLDDVKAFHQRHPGDLVVKPLHGNGGKAIFKVGRDGANLASLIEVFNTAYREPHMVQAFLPGVAEGDKRIILIDGEVTGAVNRIPGEGEIRSNLAVGGKAAKTDLTAREREICVALSPELKRRGLIFVGIDVIGGEWLTEINVTSPTGIVAIDKFNGTDTPALIWDVIERKVAERS
jgi:glutathione synthase